MLTKGRGKNPQYFADVIHGWLPTNPPLSPIPKAARMEEWGLVKKDIWRTAKAKAKADNEFLSPAKREGGLGGLEGSSDPLY